MSDQMSLADLFGFKQPEAPTPTKTFLEKLSERKKTTVKSKSKDAYLKYGNSGSLSDARDWFQTNLNTGEAVECPCCDRIASHNLVPIYNSDAHVLIWMLKAWEAKGAQGWIDMPNEAPRWIIKSRTYTKMQNWNLIEARPNEDSKKRTSGSWRPTAKGIDFTKGRIAIPKYSIMYNRDCLGLIDGELIYITDTFDEKFDYSRLMSLNYSDLVRQLDVLHPPKSK